jgi:hypothetical protein
VAARHEQDLRDGEELEQGQALEHVPPVYPLGV